MRAELGRGLLSVFALDLLNWFRSRRLELLLGACALLVYVLGFSGLYSSLGSWALALALPGLLLLSWAAGLWGGLWVGLLHIPLQSALLERVGAGSILPNFYPMFALGVLTCLAVGLLRWQHLQRLKRESAFIQTQSQTEKRLYEQEVLYRTLLETLPEGVALYDGSSIEYINPTGLRWLGYERLEEVQNRLLNEFVHPDYIEGVLERVQHLLEGRNDGLAEVRVFRRDGTPLELEISGVLVELAGRKLIMVSARDTSERKQQQAQIEYLAYNDSLTGLANREQLWQRTTALLGSDRRKNQTPALIYLDLDDFKLINDSLGHSLGDELLRQVAERIRPLLRQEDLLARLGGDEFAVLLPSADQSTATAAAGRIRAVFDAPFKLDEQSVNVQGSLGIALYPAHGETLEELARAADVALYQAKHQHGGIALYDVEQDRNSLERLNLIQDLRRALQNDQFLVQYQPILGIQGRGVEKWEALVRWMHPVRGLMRPDEFIPLAEESGLIGELDLLVLRRAVKDFVLLGGELSVNFSASTLAYPNWVREVAKALVEAQMQPSRLWLEITESALLPERQKWLSGLIALRGLGVRVALDDFGMGYSSISHLRQVPVDLVKIDKSFIRDIGQNPASEGILKAVLQLSSAFGLKTLAEGIESRQQLEWLAQQGCHFAQGYYIGLPMPPDQAASEALARNLN